MYTSYLHVYSYILCKYTKILTHIFIYLHSTHTGSIHVYLPYLSHLVTALATAHIYDTVRVRVLGQGLRDNSLAAPKGSGYCTGTTYIEVYGRGMRMSICV